MGLIIDGLLIIGSLFVCGLVFQFLIEGGEGMQSLGLILLLVLVVGGFISAATH